MTPAPYQRATRGLSATGFTILELLVVIGIMTVLVALLVSGLSRTRNSARAIACANNERGIYAAMVAFAADHDGYLPIPAIIGYTDATSSGINSMWALDANYPNGGNLNFSVGTLWPYMGATVAERQAAVQCPVDTANASTYGSTVTTLRNFSYSLNSEIGFPSTGQVSIKLSQIVKPPAKILIYEENAPNDECRFGITSAGQSPDSDDLPTGRHGTVQSDHQGLTNNIWMIQGRGNFTFFDGHVESLSPFQIETDEQQNPLNSRYYPLTQ